MKLVDTSPRLVFPSRSRIVPLLVVLGALCPPALAQGGAWAGPFDWSDQLNPDGCGATGSFLELSHGALIPRGSHRGKVILWAKSVNASCQATDTTEAWLFNPASPGTLEFVQATLDSDIFCSGMSWDRNGKLVMAGGLAHPIRDESYRFDPQLLTLTMYPVGGGTPFIDGNPWSATFYLSTPRYYQTIIGLDRRTIDSSCAPTGAIPIEGGSQLVLSGPQLSSGTEGIDFWQLLPGGVNLWSQTLKAPPSAGGLPAPPGLIEEYGLVQAPEVLLDSYARAFQLAEPNPTAPNILGQIFIAFDVDTNPLTPAINAPSLSWVVRSPLKTNACWELEHGPPSTQVPPPGTSDKYYGSAVILHVRSPQHPNRILVFGGSEETPSGWTTNDTVQEFIPGSDPVNGTWWPKTSMLFPRIFQNAVALPTGEVLVVGGQSCDSNHGALGAPCPEFTPELYDPGVLPTDPGSSTALALPNKAPVGGTENYTPRGYHNVAVLLADGRVLVAGGDYRHDLVNPQYPDAAFSGELFYPQYLFEGTRPQITNSPGPISFSPTQISFDIDATVYHDSIDRVVLTRPGAVTHHFDNDQRYIELDFDPPTYLPNSNGTQVSFNVFTPDESYGPPGWYMLWVVESKGGTLIPSRAAFIGLALN